uniref:Uncharacterized protein n=2 Tax=Salix viminalis TaxID=40686 RepID=A0A6N2LS91_SALVM
MVLKQTGDKSLGRFYETFHGTDVSIQYLFTVDIARGYLYKSLSATTEVIVESDKADVLERPVSPEIAIFYITQDTQRHPLLPEIKSGGFRVTGRISTLCSLLDPISGELTVETSAVPISSIDIHLLRVESVLVGEKIIADGDVCRNLTLPIYVILPRLLTCPSVFAGPFSIEFKVSIVISFQSELSKLHKKSDPRTPRLWACMDQIFVRYYDAFSIVRIEIVFIRLKFLKSCDSAELGCNQLSKLPFDINSKIKALKSLPWKSMVEQEFTILTRFRCLIFLNALISAMKKLEYLDCYLIIRSKCTFVDSTVFSIPNYVVRREPTSSMYKFRVGNSLHRQMPPPEEGKVQHSLQELLPSDELQSFVSVLGIQAIAVP